MTSTMYAQPSMAPMPQQQQQKPTIQKLLDDNSQLISVILDMQSKGRQMDCLEYQRTLHRNLSYLTQFDPAQTHHPNTLPPPDAFISNQQQQQQQPMMMGNNMMQPNQMGAPVSTSEQMYRAQTNSPAPSNVPPSTLNKSPHGNTPGGLYPPSSNASVTPSLQQQRSPAGSVPSPSPSGPMTSSISPHANPSNAPMNKASTPQPAMSQQQQQQHRPYLPPQGMMQQQQQPNRVMNGDPSTGQPTNSYPQGQPSYMPQTPQQQHSYPMQQNGYGHHPNGGMPQQHYPMYHQQPNPNMAVPPNQIAKPNSPLNGQQQSIIPAPSSPKPSSSSSPSQASNTQNLVANQQQQQQMAYNSYGGQQPQAMYHPQQNYHMQQQQQQQWQNQPRMMMQPQYAPYPQGQYPAAPPQS